MRKQRAWFRAGERQRAAYSVCPLHLKGPDLICPSTQWEKNHTPRPDHWASYYSAINDQRPCKDKTVDCSIFEAFSTLTCHYQRQKINSLTQIQGPDCLGERTPNCFKDSHSSQKKKMASPFAHHWQRITWVSGGMLNVWFKTEKTHDTGSKSKLITRSLS